ncbi:Tat-linked quality control protein TatD [Candidatus Gugararchaeum adminiculabundum]|nr:Tat-linked quality control protein TatD [Candidatus Gugararchaeum adminiculabundum]
MLFDAHCHLESFANPERIVSKDMLYCTSGHTHAANVKNVAIAEGKANVAVCIGIAPQEAMKGGEFAKEIAFVRENAEKGKIDAIGEIGLDYHWARKPEEQENQRKIYGKQIQLALKSDLPIVIHGRDDEGECVRALEKFGVKKAMLHCYTGDEETAAKAVSLGYLISISPFKSKEKVKVIKRVGLKYLVVESDAPGIGKVPQDTMASVEIIAGALGISREEVIGETCANAKRFFAME